MISEGTSLREEVAALGRSPATISRELRRNCSPSYGLYLSIMAHELAARRKKGAGGRPRLKGQRMASYVLEELNPSWSPEQTAVRIGIECPELSINHEAIYQYIYYRKTENKEELIGRIRRGYRKRKRKGVGRKERKTKIPGQIFIEARTDSSDNRSRFGHWEVDSLV